MRPRTPPGIASACAVASYKADLSYLLAHPSQEMRQSLAHCLTSCCGLVPEQRADVVFAHMRIALGLPVEDVRPVS